MTRVSESLSLLFSCLSLMLPVLASDQMTFLRVTEPIPSKDNTIVTADSTIILKGTLAGPIRPALMEKQSRLQ